MKKPPLKHLASCILASLTVAFAAATATAQSALLPARWNTTQRGLILVPDESHGVTMNLAVQRLRSKSPIRLDLVDGIRDNRTDFNNYDLVIILGVTGAAATAAANNELAQAWTAAPGSAEFPLGRRREAPPDTPKPPSGNLALPDSPNPKSPIQNPKSDDSWALKTISAPTPANPAAPLVIVATGNRPRSVLYAAWHLADLLATAPDLATLTTLAIQQTPRVDKRYAWICGTAYGGFGFTPPINRHTLYMATLDEMPLHGINGVFLCPDACRLAVGPGRIIPPVRIDKDGKITANDTTLPAWRTMIAMFKAYDLDVIMTVEPLVPPAFAINTIRKQYIETGNRPPGYLETLEPFYRRYIEKLIEILPDIDGYALHPGTEGTGNDGARGVRTFLTGQNLAACAESTNIYLNVIADLARRHNKTPLYWTHQFGIDSRGLTAMRNLLFKHPAITIIEEDYWPNNLWINGDRLPLMAYLDAPLRNTLTAHGNNLAILGLSDAEYYGGGALPNAITAPCIHAMTETLNRNAAMVILRLNLHDRTPLGSLWAVNGIQFAQSTALLWQNPPAPAQIWNRWIARAYGPAAAPLVSQALALSRNIIHDGFTLRGINITHHSKVSASEWMPDWAPGERKMRMFAKPGTPLITKTATDTITSQDQFAWQLDSKAMPFAEFSRLNRSAAADTLRALAYIEQARPTLAPSDHAYLREIFDNARILLDVFLAIGRAAHATNLMKDNFDNLPDAPAYFEQSMRALEDCAASPDVQSLTAQRGYVYGNIPAELRKIITAYRNYVK